MKYSKSKILLLLFASIICLQANAQKDEYLMKAIALEQLSRFIEWPAHSLNNDSTDEFIIAVLGENPFGNKLELAYSKHQIKNRKVRIMYIDTLSDIQNCHILFVSRSEKENIPKIVESIWNKPILTVGDSKGFAKDGLLTNFYIDKNKINFEVNEKGIEEANLKVSFLLLKVVKIVNSKKEN